MNDLVHLDIKAENILYHAQQSVFKIADLGLTRSKWLHNDDLNEGDARYFAPELL
jgi:serine/threonine protein kinase